MSFLENFGMKMTKAGNSISRKAKDLATESQLNSEIRQCQYNMDQAFSELGHYMYDQAEKGAVTDETVLDYVRTIDENSQAMDEKRQAIDQIKAESAAARQGGSTAAKKTCPQCGAPVDANAAFCPQCGAKLSVDEAEAENVQADALVCPKCGKPYEPGARFCDNCGARLDEDETEGDASADAQ